MPEHKTDRPTDRLTMDTPTRPTDSASDVRREGILRADIIGRVNPLIFDIARSYIGDPTIQHLSPKLYHSIGDQLISCIRFLTDPSYYPSQDRPIDQPQDTPTDGQARPEDRGQARPLDRASRTAKMPILAKGLGALTHPTELPGDL